MDTLGQARQGEGTTADKVRWLAKRKQFHLGGTPYGVTGLPVIYFSPRTGWNYGARIQWADLQRRPYRRLFLFPLQHLLTLRVGFLRPRMPPIARMLRRIDRSYP